MTIWIWVAIIALVIYLMFRRQGQKTSTVEPQEAPRKEKVIEAEEITPQPEAEHAEITAEHAETAAEEKDETKAA